MPNHEHSLRAPFALALVAGVLSVAAYAGCAAERQFGDGDDAPTTGAGDGGTGGADVASTTGSGGLDVDGGSGGVTGCVSTVVEAAPIPLDMIVLLDESASMEGAKWDGSVDALETFLSDPASAGIAVGLSMFPVPGTGPAVCDEGNYQTLLVPIGALPQSAPALIGAIDAEAPQGDTTPLPSAFEGGLSVATAQKAAHPDHDVVVVLATDGKPTCVTNTNMDMAQAAAQALASGVATYTIAIQGSDVSQLDAIAKAGGTGQVYDVTANIQAFAQKMGEIRLNAMPCEVGIPPPPMGEQLDPGLVNVGYTPGGAMDGQNIPHTGSAAACGDDQGWYYDDASAPTKILLCPATCADIKADVGARLDVAFGCKTLLK